MEKFKNRIKAGDNFIRVKKNISRAGAVHLSTCPEKEDGEEKKDGEKKEKNPCHLR